LQDRKALTFILWHVLVKILCKSEGDAFVATKFSGGCVGCCTVTTSNVLQRTFLMVGVDLGTEVSSFIALHQ